MTILALDTATLASSVAVVSGEKLIAEIIVQTKKTHSERLMVHIEQLLALAEVSKTALSGIAVSIGPGSFTGLRIGLATAKALAYALHIPIIGVSTLQALAYGCSIPEGLIAPIQDAQKGNIYISLYGMKDRELLEVNPPRVLRFEDALVELASHGVPVVFTGESAVQRSTEIVAFSALFSVAPPHSVMPRAASIGLLGQKMLLAGTVHDTMALEPFYIRRSEAEELWEKKNQGVCI